MVRSEEPPFRGNVSHVQSTRFANDQLSELVRASSTVSGTEPILDFGFWILDW